jgi:major membrane immunogen (membrane-anchored lipoprotein)
MRRISYWVLCSISILVLLVGFDASRHGGTPTAGTPPAAITSDQGTTASGTGTTGGSGRTGNGGTTRTTTVTGDVVQTQWGPVQVQLAVHGGTITAVKVLQYPNGNPRDVEIANYSLPILIKETTQSQSAQIDMVSGATYTSQGYLQSLQSALDQAGL